MICELKSTVFPKWDAANRNTCVVDYCLNIMDIARKESCGKCVLCREGTWQVYEIIKDITEGNGESDDFDLLMEILQQIKLNASCKMSKEAAYICIDLMTTYEDEWDKHIRRKRCSNLICKGSYITYIDPQLCDGCGKCMESCPEGAIMGGTQMIHVIDTQKCNKFLVCANVCPRDAIKKAGAVKPRIPIEPLPVGSASGWVDAQIDQTKRRRRRRK